MGIGATDNFDLTVGDTSNTTSTYLALFGISFGSLPTASLGDRLWTDTNANGIQDGTESGIVGQTVTLIGGGADGLINGVGDTTATTTTGADGIYSFTGLAPGVQYQVQFSKPAGTVFSTPNVRGNTLDSTDSDADTTTGKTQIVTLTPGQNNLSLDAGVYTPAVLSGYVYQDQGNDGVRDSEPPIANVLLTLTGTDGAGNAVTATTTTNASGFYQFTGLVPGTYTVSQSQPSAFLDGKDTPGNAGGSNAVSNVLSGITLSSGTPGGSNAVNDVLSGITLSSGATSSENNFGEILPASLGDRLWTDSNANGIQDGTESGIANQTITLISGGADGVIGTGGDDTTATTTTGADGIYSFTGLTPGVEYQVQFSKPDGTVFSTPNVSANTLDSTDSDADTTTGKTQIVTLNQGDSNITLDAGVYELATLSGYVYQDQGNDGVRNSEPPIANVLLTLTGTDGAGNAVTATTTTNASGFYQFTGLAPGTYTVSQSQPSAFLDGKDTPGTAGGSNAVNDVLSGITLSSGATSSENNFGELLPASLGDRLWTDSNANGIQDNGESGIANQTVTLIGGGADGVIGTGGDDTTATTTTGADGIYSFTGLTPGVEYQVQFSKPNGTVFSTPNVSANTLDSTDSDANVGTDRSSVVTLAQGENNTTIDAGVYQFANLGDRVWNDTDGNGRQDTGESGASGVTVTLFGGGADRVLGTADDTSATTTTNASGNYAFTGLTPGVQYQVGFTNLPSGTLFTTRDAAVANDTTDSDADTVTGRTPVVTLTSGETNNTLDAGLITTTGDISITKNDGLTTVFAGQSVTYSIVVSNTGPATATNALVSDLIPTNLSNVTWTSVASGGATGNDLAGTGSINDFVTLPSGSSITYTLTGTVVGPATTVGSLTRFDLAGTNSSLDGTDGNVRTFTQDGITVTANAFSRVDGTGGTWASAFLGRFGSGLGVTDSGEGNGGNDTHIVDNIGGRDNYIVFRFSESVVLDKARLEYVQCDSDISIWIGNTSSAVTSLSDAFLNGLSFNEVNDTTLTTDRLADVNAGQVAGNTVVIAASAADTTPDDGFKLRFLEVNKLASPSPTLVNTATVTAPGGFTDTNTGNNSATDTDTITAAPGVRTPGFWNNTTWRQFWDGNQTNQNALNQNGTANFPNGDLLFAPYVNNTSQPGKVTDPVTGATNSTGLLIGDFNRNGRTDAGEDTIFYSLTEAGTLINSALHPSGDVRYTLGRSLVASWLNYLAGNPIDTAAANDKDARFYIREGVNWLQALTPDENNDRKGDGALSGFVTNSSSPAIAARSTFWNNGIPLATSLTAPYNANINVSFLGGIDSGTSINSALDGYNNGLGYADGVRYGGTP